MRYTFKPHSLTGRDGRKQTLASPHMSFIFMALFARGCAKTSCAETALRQTVLRQNGCAKTVAPKRRRQTVLLRLVLRKTYKLMSLLYSTVYKSCSTKHCCISSTFGLIFSATWVVLILALKINGKSIKSCLKRDDF